MSHFTVLVIGDDIEAQLAPFQENNMGDCPKEYLEFEDKTEEVVEDFNSGSIGKIRKANGEIADRHAIEFKVEVEHSGPHKKFEFQYPEYSQKIDVPYTEIYDSVDIFCKHHYGYDKVDGKFGYFENPNAKWDWYQLGGRWSGMLKIKPELVNDESEWPSILTGSTGIMTAPPERGYADSAKIRQVDFIAMADEAAQEAHKKYDEFEKATAGLEVPPPFPEVLEKHGRDNIDAARNEYSSHPWKKALNKARLYSFGANDHDTWFLNEGQSGREDFVKKASLESFSTYAVLKDGTWYQKGKMGWWGMDSDVDENWDEQFDALLKGLDPETQISIVDCHI